MNVSKSGAIEASSGTGVMIREALPTFAAAFDAMRFLRRADSGDETQIDVKTRINDADLRHLHAFSASSKTWVMRKIRVQAPLTCEVHTEVHHYEKIMMRLREGGFSLIEMLPLETALTTVWLRKGRLPLGYSSADVTMIEWEALANGDATTVTAWRI